MGKVNFLNRLAGAVTAAVVLTAWTAAAAPPAPGTDWYTQNASADTFWIASADDLAGLAQIVNGTAAGVTRTDFYGKTVALFDDIDLSSYDDNVLFNYGMGWLPIGRYSSAAASNRPFRGTFDGRGKTVSNLYINNTNTDATANHLGLFGLIDTGGTVKNLGLADIDIFGNDTVGAVAGFVRGGRIESCYSTGTINARTRVGGIAGFLNSVTASGVTYSGTAADCRSSVNITGKSGGSNIGGIAGHIADGSRLMNCYSTGDITGSASSNSNNIGGVAGNASGTSALRSSITDCYSSGTVTGLSYYGGVAGIAAYSDISRSFSTGDIIGRSTVTSNYEYAGGVIGYVGSNSNVTNCYSTGAVTGRGIYAGGIAGYVVSGCKVANCYASGAVSVFNYAGGIAGYISSSNATGNVHVTDCAALNSSVVVTTTSSAYHHGRVSGYYGGTGNIAFGGMMSREGGWPFPSDAGPTTVNGLSVTKEQINAHGSIINLFSDADVWTIEDGKLPGLRGEAIEMPEHLWMEFHTVSFDLNGGAGAKPASVKAAVGGTVSASARPPTTGFTMDGHVSDGKWYIREGEAPDYTYEEFIFGASGAGTAVNNDITLYLQWVPAVHAEAPAITAQPEDSAIIESGSSFTLSVTAAVGDGGTLSYRWYSNTVAQSSGGAARTVDGKRERVSLLVSVR